MGIELIAAACLGIATTAWLVVAAAVAIDTVRMLLREWAPRAVTTEASLFAPDLFAPHRTAARVVDRRRGRPLAPARNVLA